MKPRHLLTGLIALALTSPLAHALEISEIEPNDRLDIAQNVDGFFPPASSRISNPESSLMIRLPFPT